MQIKGYYYEANTSQRHEALLLLTADNRVTIKVDGNVSPSALTQNIEIADIEVSPRLAQTPRVITFPDDSVFETPDNEAIDQGLKKLKSKNSLAWVHYLESRLSYALSTLVFVVFFGWGFIQYGVPIIAESTAKILPPEVKQYLAKGTLALLDKSYFSPSKLPLVRQSELLTKFNSYANDYNRLNIKVVFRHGGDIGANAFALPDGHIVFTDEMVELSDDDLELVAILGHEIGHLERRHLLRRVIQDSLLASLLVLITGDVWYASSVIIAVPAVLLELAYSRDFEVEADEFALNFLNKQSIPSEHFAHIMLQLSKSGQAKDTQKDSEDFLFEGRVSKYLSTHPVTEERIKPFLKHPKPSS